MNERIRELVGQAGIPLSSLQFSGIPTKYEVAEHELKKFAELIVWECIRLCDQVDIVGADECIDNIKEHFGVEE